MKHEETYTATNLKQVIRSRGLRQEWVAGQAGITPETLSRIAARRRNTTAETGKRIADVLQLPFYLLFEPRDRGKMPHLYSKEVA